MEENIRNEINLIIVSHKIEDNLEFILNNIPEITNMIGFEHKHPHHHLDVWNHTLEVIKNIEIPDLEINMAALLHDIGKPFSYQDDDVRHFHNHPDVSAQMSEIILKRLGYEENFIKNVCYLVRTHDTIIDTNNLDNTYDMIEKRLQLQYADAKAHNPTTVENRIQFLDNIKIELEKNKEVEK